MITQLYNPKTDFYKSFKEFVLGRNFQWYWIEKSTLNGEEQNYQNIGFYSHAFLLRSATPPAAKEICLYPKPCSAHIDQAQYLFLEICKSNNIEPLLLYRMNANLVHPTSSREYTIPHYDHEYPHKNMLVYLTDPSGGDTMCEGESFLGKEDDIIVLEGEHCHRPPIDGRRIVLVYTFLDYELCSRLK